MTAQEIKKLILKGECATIEFKLSQKELTESGFETIVGFANSLVVI